MVEFGRRARRCAYGLSRRAQKGKYGRQWTYLISTGPIVGACLGNDPRPETQKKGARRTPISYVGLKLLCAALEKVGTGRREGGGEQTCDGLKRTDVCYWIPSTSPYDGYGDTPSALAHLAAAPSGQPVTTTRRHGDNQKEKRLEELGIEPPIRKRQPAVVVSTSTTLTSVAAKLLFPQPPFLSTPLPNPNLVNP